MSGDDVLYEFSSQTIGGELAESPSMASVSKGGDGDAGRLRLPALTKPAWTPNGSKRVGFNSEAAEPRSSPASPGPKRSGRTPSSGARSPSRRSPTGGPRSPTARSPSNQRSFGESDDESEGALTGGGSCCLCARVREPVALAVIADVSNIPSVPIDPAVLAKYQAELRRRFEEVRVPCVCRAGSVDLCRTPVSH